MVDASVAAKWFFQEEGSDRADCLLGGPLVAPDLLHAEVASIAWKRVRRGQISADLARREAAALIQMPIEIVPLTNLVSPALHIAVEFDRSIYDSIYLALAVGRSLTFLTADEKLVNSLAGTRLSSYVERL